MKNIIIEELVPRYFSALLSKNSTAIISQWDAELFEQHRDMLTDSYHIQPTETSCYKLWSISAWNHWNMGASRRKLIEDWSTMTRAVNTARTEILSAAENHLTVVCKGNKEQARIVLTNLWKERDMEVITDICGCDISEYEAAVNAAKKWLEDNAAEIEREKLSMRLDLL